MNHSFGSRKRLTDGNENQKYFLKLRIEVVHSLLQRVSYENVGTRKPPQKCKINLASKISTDALKPLTTISFLLNEYKFRTTVIPLNLLVILIACYISLILQYHNSEVLKIDFRVLEQIREKFKFKLKYHIFISEIGKIK